jgi:hypothetical protein
MSIKELTELYKTLKKGCKLQYLSSISIVRNQRSSRPMRSGAYFIKELQLAELQIAERAHWPLLCVSMAMANACVLQFAILQFCKLQFFYEIGPRGAMIPWTALIGGNRFFTATLSMYRLPPLPYSLSRINLPNRSFLIFIVLIDFENYTKRKHFSMHHGMRKFEF